MVIDRKLNTQVTLPVELYRAIARKAQINDRSVSNEIVELLASALARGPNELEREFESLEAEREKSTITLEESLEQNR
jgi:DNA polymerase III delta subunit